MLLWHIWTGRDFDPFWSKRAELDKFLSRERKVSQTWFTAHSNCNGHFLIVFFIMYMSKFKRNGRNRPKSAKLARIQYLQNRWSHRLGSPLILTAMATFLLVFLIICISKPKGSGRNKPLGKRAELAKTKYLENKWSHRPLILTTIPTSLLMFLIIYKSKSRRSSRNTAKKGRIVSF